MNYRHVYMLIIEHAKLEMKNGLRPTSKQSKKLFPNQYFEFHHILPRSIYPLWDKRKSNQVALTAREHFFCHQLLVKIFEKDPIKFAKMSYALMIFCNQNNCIPTSREYERIRENCAKATSILRKGQPQSPKRIKWLKNNKEFLSERQKQGWTETVRESFSQKKKDYFNRMSDEERARYKKQRKCLLNNPDTKLKMSEARKGKLLYENQVSHEKHYFTPGKQPIGYELVNKVFKCKSPKEVHEAYLKYKSDGGILMWNDFQKAFKQNDYKITFS